MQRMHPGLRRVRGAATSLVDEGAGGRKVYMCNMRSITLTWNKLKLAKIAPVLKSCVVSVYVTNDNVAARIGRDVPSAKLHITRTSISTRAGVTRRKGEGGDALSTYRELNPANLAKLFLAELEYLCGGCQAYRGCINYIYSAKRELHMKSI